MGEVIRSVENYFLFMTVYNKHKPTVVEKRDFSSTVLQAYCDDARTPEAARKRVLPVVLAAMGKGALG